MVSFWCLAHRLELSLKDPLTSTDLYATIDEMLMRVHYLYEKSIKKCHELDEVVAFLRQCLEESEMFTARTRGNRPVHACGTRYVSHKVAAINRFIEHHGAYINHLIALTEDPSIKSADKQKLKGYVGKWQEANSPFTLVQTISNQSNFQFSVNAYRIELNSCEPAVRFGSNKRNKIRRTTAKMAIVLMK